jgi:peptide/nickel transport system substrate-binding protein
LALVALLVGVSGLLLLVAAACGGSDEEAAPAAPVATQAPAAAQPTQAPAAAQPTQASVTAKPTAAPAVNQPKYGGELHVRTYADNPNYDVQQNLCGCVTSSGAGVSYQRLLRYDGESSVVTPGESYLVGFTFEGALAESWEIVSPTEYVFKIRKGVLWHKSSADQVAGLNGRELTAEDIVFAYGRQATEGFTNAALLNGVIGIEALDKFTLKLTLDGPNADLLVNLADGHSKIVSPEAVEAGGGHLKEGPTIGTNAWMFVRAEKGVGTFFERNPDFSEKDEFGNQLPYADKLTFHLIRDEATRMSAFRAGRLDRWAPSAEQFEVVTKESPDLPWIKMKRMGSGQIFGMDVTEPPFSDVNFRRAVFLALNDKDIRTAALGGWGYSSVGFPVPSADALMIGDDFKPWVNDPAKAKELIAQTGLKTPIDIELNVANYGEAYLTTAELAVAQLQAVGINATIKVIDPTQYTTKVLYGEVGYYELFLGPIQPTPSPNASLLNIYLSTGGQNTAGINDPELDKMIMDQSVETNAAKRSQMLLDIQEYLMNQAIRFAPGTSEGANIWYPYLKNYSALTGSYGYENYNRMWLDN